MSSFKTPSVYEIDTIAEHTMRRLFTAQGRDWEHYCPDDAQCKEWITQALTAVVSGMIDAPVERSIETRWPADMGRRAVADVLDDVDAAEASPAD